MDGSPSGSCFLLVFEFPSRELCSNTSFQGFGGPSGNAVSAGWGRCLGCFLWSPMDLTMEQCWESWAQKGALMVLLQTLAPHGSSPLMPVLHPFLLAHPHETTDRPEMSISFQTHNQNTANFKIKKIFQPVRAGSVYVLLYIYINLLHVGCGTFTPDSARIVFPFLWFWTSTSLRQMPPIFSNNFLPALCSNMQ